MDDRVNFRALKLDRWVASSLLQKAIRRGEADYAQSAARAFAHYRGKAIWRRLVTIGFEDVGIADPQLLAELTYIACDTGLRAAVADDTELIDDFCVRLATASKDRSADYLYCASITKFDRTLRIPGGANSYLAIAADNSHGLVDRAEATLRCCTVDGKGQKVSEQALTLLLETSDFGPVWKETSLAAVRLGCHPFILMLPLLHSALAIEGQETETTTEDIPPLQLYNGAPLYAFDKHTSVGRQAIALLITESDELQTILAVYAPKFAWQGIVEIAAFYTDAAPVKSRFRWSRSLELEAIGLEADMTGMGCPLAGIKPVLQCVRNNLHLLNDLRRQILSRRTVK